jgi:protein SCO1/2
MRFAVWLVLAAVLAAPPAVAGESPIAFGGPFELVDHRGVPRTDRDFLGRHTLIFFGYTHCETVCPTDLQVMAEALDRLGPLADRVQPLFVSVDPARDTPERLARFLAGIDGRILGLTGSEAQVAGAARAYRVMRHRVGLAEGGRGVVHGPMTFLMGPDGEFVTLFPHDTDPAFMAAAVRRHLAAS